MNTATTMEVYIDMDRGVFRTKLESMTLDKLRECANFFEREFDEARRIDATVIVEAHNKENTFLELLQKGLIRRLWKNTFEESHLCDEQSEMTKYVDDFWHDCEAILEIRKTEFEKMRGNDSSQLIRRLSSSCHEYCKEIYEKLCVSIDKTLCCQLKLNSVQQKINHIINDSNNGSGDDNGN